MTYSKFLFLFLLRLSLCKAETIIPPQNVPFAHFFFRIIKIYAMHHRDWENMVKIRLMSYVYEAYIDSIGRKRPG